MSRLEEIKDEMKALLEEATKIVKAAVRSDPTKKIVLERATNYWIGNIATSLDRDSDYVGYDYSIQDTIDELGKTGDPDDEEAESDGTDDSE